jgi:hypothetical protein
MSNLKSKTQPKDQSRNKRKCQGKLFLRELSSVKLYSFGDGLECRLYGFKEKLNYT